MNTDGFNPMTFSSNQSINLLTNPIILSSNEYLDDLAFNDMKSKLYFKRIPLKLALIFDEMHRLQILNPNVLQKKKKIIESRV